ncbi:hypothetical protein G5I_02809 [Acromyrmex echinatior]|uniref:Uncharacterized protein n=1 Tax=Acromyrmex echinatior TaxID=103372 RepID=F4WBA2_ACREC|nr:hypothetical protein G5I_02809 [Acromyrmex echinatior]
MYKYLRERLLAQSLSLLPPFFLTVSRVPYSSQVPPGGAKNHALVYNEPSGLKAAPYIDSLMVRIPFYKIAERCEIIYRVEQALVIADKRVKRRINLVEHRLLPDLINLALPGLSDGERRQVISNFQEQLSTLCTTPALFFSWFVKIIADMLREIFKYMLNYQFSIHRHRINGDGSKRTSDYKCVLAQHSGEEAQKVALLSAVQRRFTLSKF